MKAQKRETKERNIKQDQSTGRYYVTLYYGTDGKEKKRQTVTCATLKEARNIRDKHEYERKTFGKKSYNPQITVGECAEEYIKQKIGVLSPTTITGYKNILKRLNGTALSRKKIVSVKKRDIQEYIDSLRKTGEYKAKTINGDRQFLSVVFSYAVDYEYIAVNEVAKIKKLDEEEFACRTLSADELTDFLLRIEASENLQIITAVALGVQALRRGEIAGLRWENISFERNTIRVIEAREPTSGGGVISKEPKTKSSIREIPLTPFLKKQLLAYKQYQEERSILGDYVIVTEAGKPIYPQQINNTFSRILKKYGLEHIRLHDLRHTACTLMIENGATFADVAKYLGHSSSRTTESRYTHLTNQSATRAGAVLTSVLSGISAE